MTVSRWDDEVPGLGISQQFPGLSIVESSVNGTVDNSHGHGLVWSQSLLIVDAGFCEHDQIVAV